MSENNNFQRPGEENSSENGYVNGGSSRGFSDEPAGNAAGERSESRQNTSGAPGAGWQSYPPQSSQQEGQTGSGQQGGSNGASPQGGQGYQFKMADYDEISSSGAAAKHKSNTGLKIFAVIISVLLVVTLAALGGLLLYAYQNSSGSDSLTAASNSLQEEPSAPAVDITLHNRPAPEDEAYTDGVLSTEEIYVKVRPSVVGIVTYSASNPFQASSSGSGIILSGDGYIITNAHVVSGAYGIVVVLDNDEEYEAELIGIDEQTDLAVIKIDAENLTAAEFGNSDELVVGERIVAIGNPTGLNLAGSTTQGVVSGLNRNITLTNETDNSTISMEVIQVDAAINPGNSGGALINKYGQVVGINSSKLASTNIEGIGFAIPINNAKPIADDLIQYGYVRGRVRLGITYYPISEVLGAMYGYTPGLLVYSVDESMDVAAKGVKAGDTITQIDGQDVRDSEGVKAILEGKEPGDTIELTVYRQSVTGKTSTFKVRVELAEDKGSLNTTDQSDSGNNQDQQGQQSPFQLP